MKIPLALTVILIPFLACPFPGRGQGLSGYVTETARIEKVISSSIGWAKEKDTALLFSVMAHDTSFFIYHPDAGSTITGYRMFHDFAIRSWLRPEFKATTFRIKDFRVNFSGSGDVAWFSCLLDDHGEWNGKPAGWDNCRWTGVLENRKGNWVIVQMHFSFAATSRSE